MDEQPPSVALVGYARFSLPQQQQVSLPLPAPDSTRTSGGGHDAAGGAQPPALLACGATSTLIALIDGRVYACGAELGGELLGAACSAARHTDVASNLVELPLAPPVPCSRSVLALACGPHHVFMALAGGGGVWAWGLDATGQTLGLGGCNRRWCLSCGGNKSGGQETGTDSSTVTAPRQVVGLEDAAIKAIAAGESHALAVSTDGRSVWGWGCGSSGQLGIGRRRRCRRASNGGEVRREEGEEVTDDREVCSCRPLPLDLSALGDDAAPVTVEQVAVGKRHSLLLTGEGRVLSFGSGLYHALGHGRVENEWEPRLVEALEGIGEMRADGRFVGGMAAIACGAWHSLALSRTGDVYGWGWARHGLLGRVGEMGGVGDGTAATLVPAPRLLPLPSDPGDEDVEIKQIGAGVHYSAGLGRDGRLCVWGTLGLVAEDEEQGRPAQPNRPWDPVKAMNMGMDRLPVRPSLSLACGAYHAAALGWVSQPTR